MIQIMEKDLQQAVEKAVLVMGPKPSTVELIKNLQKYLTEMFNKAGIEILVKKEEVKYSLGPTKTIEQRISDLEQMVYNLNKRNGIK